MVGTRFLNNPTGEEIWLHIDDGKMGGGGNIDYFKEKVGNANWAIDNGYFQHQNNNFYYCLFAHYPEDHPKWYEFWEGSTLGVASCPGYKLCLFDENLVSAKDQAHVFLHELAHNLIGNYFEIGSKDGDHNPSASHLIDTDEDPEAEHCGCGNCALQTELSSGSREEIIDLCYECWNAIRFDGRDGSFTN